MSTPNASTVDPFAGLRRFDGDPRSFWSSFATRLLSTTCASGILVAVRQLGSEQESPWRLLARIVPDAQQDYFPSASVKPLMESAALGNSCSAPSDRPQLQGHWCAAPLLTGSTDQQCIALIYLPGQSEAEVRTAQLALAQAADIPEFYLLWQQFQEREQDVQKLAGTLDMLGRMREMPRFESAALFVCNDLAKRFNCKQVSLAWKVGDYFRIKAISHTPRFEAKMSLVQAMEQVAEEAADQGEDICFPAPEGQESITRLHQSYAQANDLERVASVCLWQDGQVLAVLLLQDAPTDFSLQQLRALRVIADQVVEPLYHAHLRTGWLGQRIARAGRDWAKRQWNLEHPWIKLSVVLAVVALGVLIFGGMTYRVEAPFVLRTADELLIPAPFEGFLDSTAVRTGDLVQAGQVLARLDRSELLLQEVALLADRTRFISEAERARGRNELAEMRVAQAQRQQTEAALSMVRAQLAAAELRAPFEAFIADDFGLATRAGAPLRRGDVLIRLARLDALFLEIDLPERHIHHVRLASPGEFAFATRPDLRFPFSVQRIEPMGIAVDAGNIFRLRGSIHEEQPADWWRPGMTGLVKIEVGRRSFFWILTHRLVDWLRIQLWL